MMQSPSDVTLLQHNYNSGLCDRQRPVYKYMLPGQQRLSYPAMLGTGLGLDNTLLHIHHNVTALVKSGADRSFLQYKKKQVKTYI